MIIAELMPELQVNIEDPTRLGVWKEYSRA